MAPADGGVFGRGFNEFSVFRVVGASLTPHPLSPRLGPCSPENNPSFLGLTSVNGSGEEVLREQGRLGVGVWGADPANTGTATKAGITMAAPSNKGLV